MRSLHNLIQGLKVVHTQGNSQCAIGALAIDSRAVQPGTCFVAVRGVQTDGHQYIAQAVAQGAVAVVCEQYPAELLPGVCYVQVSSTEGVAGHMAQRFYGHPSAQLKLVGVTGTNGKTTTVTLLHSLFERLGYKVGLLSTVVNKIHTREVESTHTTPDPISLNALLAQMVDEGCEYCFMEVSSHSVVQRRIEGLEFAGAVFTNLTHDHLDYHQTFANYLQAKKTFFDNLPAGAFALTNADDRNGKVMVQNTKARSYTYGLRSLTDFKCRLVEQHLDGMLLSIDGVEVWTSLIGDFNAYNLTAVYGTALLLGADKAEVLQHLSGLHAVSGRFEYVKSAQGITAVVDYAHTPDALRNVIDTINRLRINGQSLITVVGCGGNRDKAKRPVMAQIASEFSDKVVLTSDNPRHERPEDILKDMEAGVPASCRNKVFTITDRREGIKTAVAFAQKQDIILVAGKGHETYQIVGDTKHHFDDKEVLCELFALLEK